MMPDEINFCVRCGASLSEEMRFGQPRPVCPACGWIYFADPKVAVAALVERNGEVLLVRRAISPQRGRWTLPAGFLDAGEDPARAAERECLEETGLLVRVTRLADLISGQEHPRGSHLLLVYSAEILGGELHPGDDVDQVDFFSRADLPPLAFTSTHRILHNQKA